MGRRLKGTAQKNKSIRCSLVSFVPWRQLDIMTFVLLCCSVWRPMLMHVSRGCCCTVGCASLSHDIFVFHAHCAADSIIVLGGPLEKGLYGYRILEGTHSKQDERLSLFTHVLFSCQWGSCGEIEEIKDVSNFSHKMAQGSTRNIICKN